MSFSVSEKAAIVSIWKKASGDTETLGAEALERLFLSFPQTKTYFSRFDLSHNSADLRTHGGKVLNAIGDAVNHLDNINKTLAPLRDIHAKLNVDPGNFVLLNHAIQITLASHFPNDFTAPVQAAWSKFLAAVTTALTAK
ncbi:hemoglobin subunit alpha-5-like [Ascaphus truei]|uniref:hemoglobin subunit alpha-5-like n=1 Tax=Ascaphus truei TaxID=8439 RepID=UPI003F5A382E